MACNKLLRHFANGSEVKDGRFQVGPAQSRADGMGPRASADVEQEPMPGEVDG